MRIPATASVSQLSNTDLIRLSKLCRYCALLMEKRFWKIPSRFHPLPFFPNPLSKAAQDLRDLAGKIDLLLLSQESRK